MNEAETRAEYIDPALAVAGWGIVEGSRIRREYPITLGRLEGAGKRGKALTADYVLEYRNTKLAVVEAKAWDKALTEGVSQAKDYAGKLRVRFTYATNGQAIYGIDMDTAVEGEITQFPSPDALWHLTFATQSAWRDRFAAVPFEDKGGFFQGRYYQDIAIERVLAAIVAGQERILLTLATGTGKTFIAFQIAWKLFQSRWNLTDAKAEGEPTRRPRILFLADRNILADQAYNAFSAFDDKALVRIDPADIRKKGKVPKNGSLFFTIFQTFMSGVPKDGQPSPYFGEYPPALLRLHRHRRMPSGRRQRREQLARHPRLFCAGRAAWPDGDAEAQGQRRYLCLFRRAGVRLLAQRRYQRRLSDAVPSRADFDHPRRVCLYARRPGGGRRSRRRRGCPRPRRAVPCVA